MDRPVERLNGRGGSDPALFQKSEKWMKCWYIAMDRHLTVRVTGNDRSPRGGSIEPGVCCDGRETAREWCTIEAGHTKAP